MESIYTPCDNRDERSSAPIVVPTMDDSRGPSCPECGDETGSRGKYWFCPTCGRWTVKDARNTQRKSAGLGITCPKCGTLDPVSSGHRWLCPKCGRQWAKNRCNAIPAR